jgi:hypothetical protein
MSVPKQFNLVSFKIFGVDDDPQDPWANQVRLTLEASWKITAGVKPDVNVARVPWQEFEKLYRAPTPTPPDPDGEDEGGSQEGAKPTLHTSGDVYFYYSSETAPETVMENVTLIQIEPLEIGTVRVPDPADPHAPPTSVKRVVVYRLWFADFRQQFQPPRGGFLTEGEINKDDAAVIVYTPNSVLARKCLVAMGLIGVNPPETMDYLPPMKNLNWMGAHAATELAKILEYTGHVFCPNAADPEKSIQRIGTGEEPVVPADREAPALVIEGANRVDTVIVTSAPTPIYDTFDSSAVNGPRWYFVARDINDPDPKSPHKGQWLPLDLVDDVGGDIKGEELVRTEFASISDLDRRFTLYNDLFRFIQLDVSRYPAGKGSVLRAKLLQEPTDSSGFTRARDVVVEVPQAPIYIGSGKWTQAVVPNQMPAVWLNSNSNILSTFLRIGRLDTPGPVEEADVTSHFRLSVDFRVHFTVEAWDATAGQKQFLYFGFKAGADPINDPPQDIPDEDARRIFLFAESTQAVIIQMPELRYVRLNGTQIPDQLERMRKKAQARAADALRTLSRPVKHRFISGFYAVEISGRVTQIELDQDKVMTRLRIDQFHVPTLDQRREQIKRFSEGNFPGQQIVHAQSVQFGGSGETQAAVPVMAMPMATPVKAGVSFATFAVNCTKDDGETGTQTTAPTYTYTVKTKDGVTTLGTKMTPEWGRSNGDFTAATKGIGYKDPDGTFHLLIVNEIEGTGLCSNT